jgi:hypothetical protein
VNEPNERDIEDEGMHDMMKYVTYTLYKKFLLMSLVVHKYAESSGGLSTYRGR